MRYILLLVVLLQSSFGFSQEKFNWAASQKFQQELNKEYANRDSSPLMAEDLATFKGLDFYPISKKFFVNAHFVRTPNEKPFKMKTSTNRTPVYVKYGEVHFEIDGQKCKLNVYQDLELIQNPKYKDDLFLPFFDKTSGKESYIGGKYIDLKIPKGNTIAIDFNTSYNPYCAYSYRYSCPKVPLENDLKVAIRAGVKKFHD
ncbi:DUF1684 domain-containing protein [Flavobacterium sufflavum]|uniref:DUF1684 domain-containing protein n=1 Tax=Flavobacterium sufflavum TaxID=1921138 RepID=A0A3S3SU72_9FLAO|nr:DUF1684 domain-containing protein [Flavobacterium sufflavum]RVT74905.1 DUF1684 domain-containing protein [Flavobacterium sufflavum]